MEIQYRLFKRQCDTCCLTDGCAVYNGDQDCIGCRRYISIKSKVNQKWK